MKTNTSSPAGFDTLAIAPKLLARIGRLGYTIPTPIQHRSIPLLIEGKDLLGIAQTGTGKTLAFAIPVIQRLAHHKGISLVIVPTRELALQVNETFVNVGKEIGLRTTVLIGGADIRRQMKELKNRPHIIIGTPGRIIDHLERKSVKLDQVKILVLDEADRMLDMGFAPQIARILQTVPSDRQTMLFSATMPAEIHKIANSYMQSPVRVEIARSGSTIEKITQELRYVDASRKGDELKTVIEEHSGSTLIFMRTRHSAHKLGFQLHKDGYSVAEIHSDRSLSQRRAALDGFKSGRYRILVATDIAGRGIDVSGIELVVNYDLPESPEDYVHRIGRTGRAGKMGHAVSFSTMAQRMLVRRIEKLLGTTIPVKSTHQASHHLSHQVTRPTARPASRTERSFSGSRSSRVPHESQRPSTSKSKTFKEFRRGARPQRSEGPKKEVRVQYISKKHY